MDYVWGKRLGLVRKPTSFTCTISDDRGDELLYSHMKIGDVFEKDLGLGGVISLLWLQRELPKWATKFIEAAVMITADHGPCVSGAHNAIVTARAGKDLISSIVSGMLTIGPRFGGALDGAARYFSGAYDRGLTPEEFVLEMAQKRVMIPGIGHRIKSLDNPDKRCAIVKAFCADTFPSCEILNFAKEVELITTRKRNTLILNVDGIIAVAFVDLLRNLFSREEADKYVEYGALNALFVLGRTVGLIGHYIDQKFLKSELYRHPWDDVQYCLPKKPLEMDGDRMDLILQ
eukprot:NODE_311_length_998_cov_283.800000_g307_i0.p1 GENE.NODE_311_length_998_cov_283.800000_g307_i0~~NODE_311_length_998_cov_283.800000_g307_i0.p1  ORF type:complete len:299 (-),score=60.59 NODE_311_length_998_cov_283.800000_g307_i0:100-966(-)